MGGRSCQTMATCLMEGRAQASLLVGMAACGVAFALCLPGSLVCLPGSLVLPWRYSGAAPQRRNLQPSTRSLWCL